MNDGTKKYIIRESLRCYFIDSYINRFGTIHTNILDDGITREEIKVVNPEIIDWLNIEVPKLLDRILTMDIDTQQLNNLAELLAQELMTIKMNGQSYK
jgi:hypothetical protein